MKPFRHRLALGGGRRTFFPLPASAIIDEKISNQFALSLPLKIIFEYCVCEKVVYLAQSSAGGWDLVRALQ